MLSDFTHPQTFRFLLRLCTITAAVVIVMMLNGCFGEKSKQGDSSSDAAKGEGAKTSGKPIDLTGVRSDLIQVIETPDGPLYFAKMATVNGIEENRKFQRNLEFVRQKIQVALGLKQEYETTLDPDARKELKAKLDAAEKEADEYNQKLVELYRVNFSRNYVVVPETSHLYVRATDEEFKKVKEMETSQTSE